MKRVAIIAFVVLVIALSSCLTHFFAEPIPIGVKDDKTMPKVLIGEWQKDDEIYIIDKTTWVKQWVDTAGVKNSKIEQKLCDSLKIRKSGKYYYFNNLQKNGYWVPYVGFKNKNMFIIKRMGDADTAKIVSILGIKADSVPNEHEFYYNQKLTPKQLKLYIEKGGFADTLMLFDLKNKKVIK
jgi:hypothetical protein